MSEKNNSKGNGTNDDWNAPVTIIDNHVYFCCDVNVKNAFDLIKALREVDAKLVGERLTRAIPKGHPRTPIWLHVSSWGGSLYEALSIADQIQLLNSPVSSIVEGLCASGGTIVSMACKYRLILPNSHMLIHQLRGFEWGKYEDLKDTAVHIDELHEIMIKFYKKHSKLKRKAIRKLLKRESYFTAKQALEVGFIDEIVGGK